MTEHMLMWEAMQEEYHLKDASKRGMDVLQDVWALWLVRKVWRRKLGIHPGIVERRALRSGGQKMNKLTNGHRPPLSQQQVVRALRKLEKVWPKEYWLFAASVKLTLMKKKNGVRAVCGKETGYADGGMDPKQIVATFGGIECDGGDW